MAYELDKNPLDVINEILCKYKKNVAILKCDIQCKHGRFLKDSIVYIESDIVNNKIILPDNTIEIKIKIFDCSERKSLDDYEPYKTYDIFAINVESIEKLINILNNLFVIDDNRTKCHEEYMSLRHKVRKYVVNERCVCELIGKGFLLSTIIVIFLLALDIDYNIFYKVNNGFKYTKYGIIILGAIMVLCWCIKIFITLGVMHKTKNLEKIADNLHTKICEQKN